MEMKRFMIKIRQELSAFRYTRRLLIGTETLLTYPSMQTHADVPEQVRIKNGITDRVLRLSAGIEDKNDLIADLKQAFASFGK